MMCLSPCTSQIGINNMEHIILYLPTIVLIYDENLGTMPIEIFSEFTGLTHDQIIFGAPYMHIEPDFDTSNSDSLIIQSLHSFINS